MLKKCCICGGEPRTRFLLSSPPKYQVYCGTPNCERSVVGQTMEEAEAKWNNDPETKNVPPERDIILAIINDAMKNRDRYVSLFFGERGVAVTVHHVAEDE